MPVVKDVFQRISDEMRAIKVDAPARRREAAREIAVLMFQALLRHSPVSDADDRGLRPSAWQSGRPAISDGWGVGPEIFSMPTGVSVSIKNTAPHVKYFVWQVGNVRNTRLGTAPHRIPSTGHAKDVYGHPLVFWWQRAGRVETRHSHVEHPGFTPAASFVDQAWAEVSPQATEISRQAARTMAFDRLRKIWT